METLISYTAQNSHIVHSDPTYEAWKREKNRTNVVFPLTDSDPTYEAWKLSL